MKILILVLSLIGSVAMAVSVTDGYAPHVGDCPNCVSEDVLPKIAMTSNSNPGAGSEHDGKLPGAAAPGAGYEGNGQE